jgi:hypothetical protein
MLTGLIFATDDADDRPDMLSATLRFGGMTLFEYQARLLIDAGAGQILVAVRRVTPELLGAINRTAKRGVAVDVVRSAAEAAATIHPLAHMVVIADGLVTTEAVVARLSGDGDEALLVTGEADTLPGFERIDAATCWAGIARIDAQRLDEVAALPGDYDFESTLLRVAAQSGVQRIPLGQGSARAGHGIERDSRALGARGKVVFAGLAAHRPSWIDRFGFAPLARLALPQLMERDVPEVALIAGGGAAAAIAAALLVFGWAASGLAVGMLGIATFSLGAMLSRIRGEDGRERLQEQAAAATAAALCLLTGLAVDSRLGTMTGLALAVALVIAAALAERAAAPRNRRRWWGVPAAYPLLLLPFAAGGIALPGLAAVGLYAAATLTAAIEALREKP